jgi:hypothetical protein
MDILFGHLSSLVSLRKSTLEEGHPMDKSFDIPLDGHQHNNVFCFLRPR